MKKREKNFKDYKFNIKREKKKGYWGLDGKWTGHAIYCDVYNNERRQKKKINKKKYHNYNYYKTKQNKQWWTAFLQHLDGGKMRGSF